MSAPVLRPVHSMIRVRDEDRAVAFYRDGLGLTRIERHAFDGFTLIYLAPPEGGFEVELTVNHDRDRSYAPGEGYGHLAVTTDDLEAAHAHLTALGHAPEPIRDFQKDGAPFARFFFVTDPEGYRIEVLARTGRFA